MLVIDVMCVLNVASTLDVHLAKRLYPAFVPSVSDHKVDKHAAVSPAIKMCRDSIVDTIYILEDFFSHEVQ
jgi:hypothetical protein